MIIWSGLGLLIVPIVVVCIALSAMLTHQFFPDPDYIDLHSWPIGVAFFASAVSCWFLGLRLRNSSARTLVDPNTGQPVILRRSHSLFFFPMHWWGVLFIFIGIGFCFMNKTPEELKADREMSAVLKEEKAAARDERMAAREAKRAASGKVSNP